MQSTKPHILVADGDSQSRTAVMWCLVSHGYRAQTVSSGFAALLALDSADPPDAAIVDLGLPTVFSGRRLIDVLQASSRFGDLPIIATGVTKPFAELPAGMTFLEKPIDPDRLLLRLAELRRGRADAGAMSGRTLPPPARNYPKTG
jgi:CheY-like chemotaxis protein